MKGTIYIPYFASDVQQQILGEHGSSNTPVPVRVEKESCMKARILDRADVLKIVDLLRQQGYEVIAPFCGHGRDTYFDAVTDAEPRPGADSLCQSLLSAQALRFAAHRAIAQSDPRHGWEYSH